MAGRLISAARGLGLGCVVAAAAPAAVLSVDFAWSSAFGPLSVAAVMPQRAPADPHRGAPAPPAMTPEAIVSRPLFSPSRAPFAPAPTPPAPEPAPLRTEPPAPPRAVLAGIVITPGARKALLRTSDGEEARWLAEGDEVTGWTLEAIEPGGARLVNGALRAFLPLHRAAAASAAIDRSPNFLLAR